MTGYSGNLVAPGSGKILPSTWMLYGRQPVCVDAGGEALS